MFQSYVNYYYIDNECYGIGELCKLDGIILYSVQDYHNDIEIMYFIQN